MRSKYIKLSEALQEKGYVRGPFGSALKRSELKKEEIPVYEQQHAITGRRDFRFYIDQEKYEELERFTVQPNDIIISCSGTIGKPSLIKENDPIGIISQALLILRCNEKIVLPHYLYYFLTSPAGFHSITSVSSGSVQVNIAKRDIIENIEIPYNPLNVQKRIVSILKCLDDQIELNRKINENLKQQARAIFAENFLRVSEIPDGWKKGSLLGIADYLNGLAMQRYRPEDGETGLPVLKIKELRQGACDAGSEQCSPGIKPEYIVHDGDVVFSWSGSLLVDFWCGGTCGLNQHLFKVTSREYDKWFYYSWTVHHLGHFAAIAADKATTMGHIKREELAKAEVLIPSKSDYDRIGAVLAPIYDLIIANRIENRKLSESRDELLPKLMSGEVLFPDKSEVINGRGGME